MTPRALLLAPGLLLAVVAVFAQDPYQLLRDQSGGYAPVQRGKALSFPRDHSPHPDYRIEWWYLTANLSDAEGREWGLQWTLFRQALSPGPQSTGWQSNQLWMAHAALTSPQGHQFEQRFARGGIGQGGVSDITQTGKFEAWLDDWQWVSNGASPLPGSLKFSVGDKRVEMQLSGADAWVLNGDRGYSQKSQLGQASYYYSQPAIVISGSVSDDDGTVALQGSAWLDREWSSQALAPDQQGWDWFALQLDDGSKLMLYRLRQDDGQHWLSGTRILPDGSYAWLQAQDIELVALATREIKTTDEQQAALPLEWRIRLKSENRVLKVRALYDQQWMATRFPYWEGVVLVQDAEGKPAGRGYMELTGYQ